VKFRRGHLPRSATFAYGTVTQPSATANGRFTGLAKTKRSASISRQLRVSLRIRIHPSFQRRQWTHGRLWQTLILSKWKPALTYLPVETVIRNQQSEYYAALSTADQASDANGFAEFMLHVLLATMREVVLATPRPDSSVPSRHQVGTKLKLISDQLFVFEHIEGELSLVDLMALLNRKDRTKFRQQVLAPLIDLGLVEVTIPDKPTSSR
jgi:hypothetical protein